MTRIQTAYAIGQSPCTVHKRERRFVKEAMGVNLTTAVMDEESREEIPPLKLAYASMSCARQSFGQRTFFRANVDTPTAQVTDSSDG